MNQSVSAVPNYGFIAVLFAAFLWGTTGTVASFAPNLSPLAVGAAAMGGGGLLQALLARKSIIYHLAHIKANAVMLAVGIIAVFIYPLAFYSSMHYAGITIGTVVSIGTAPLFTALLERVFDRKELSMTWLMSFVLGVTGVALLSLGESHAVATTEHLSQNRPMLGIALGAVAGLTYALYSWAAKRMIDRGMDAKASMGLIFGLGSLLLLPTLWITGSNLFEENINLYVVGYMMLIPMFLGYVLFGYGLKTVPASKAITLTLFEPLVAAVFAILLVGEQLAPIGWIGMVLISICLALLTKAK
ncbi:EamA family transporter [Acinetobacter sp. 8I-beige]|uniref:DMT family transporter n=1 Tax=Acinetobacter sp. 8I-beige TaxID=2653125 RepID=UPI0012F16043|nr:EamA family transporter [Acinetobacter sp. 8I-beige]VXA87068.1 EamA family transporter [Acinetobacter sp. 8I-beige]